MDIYQWKKFAKKDTILPPHRNFKLMFVTFFLNKRWQVNIYKLIYKFTTVNWRTFTSWCQSNTMHMANSWLISKAQHKAQFADEWKCREEMERLSLNIDGMEEMIVDFRRRHGHHFPLHTNGTTVERVKSSKDLTWTL